MGHLAWTVVHVICVATLVAASKHALRNWQSRFMLATAVIDVGLLIVTWWCLRRCRRVVDGCISRGEVKGIHRTFLRQRNTGMSSRLRLWLRRVTCTPKLLERNV